MAVDITAALRRVNPDDPVRYDFSLCHVGMMNACRFGRVKQHDQCPLRGFCNPRPSARKSPKPKGFRLPEPPKLPVTR